MNNPTTADYLESLQNDMQTLKTNVEAKGVEVSDSDNFTTLSSKVADISVGRWQDYFNEKPINIDNTLNSWIKKVPLIDTSLVATMRSAFQNCTYITTIPQLDTSNVTNMQNMFTNCPELTSIPLLNTSNVTTMATMFSQCGQFTNMPALNTNNVQYMQYMFSGCIQLTTVPKLNASKVVGIADVFQNCMSLTEIGGFENLGEAYLTTQSANYTLYKLNLSVSSLLTHDSLMNVINNLYDIATKGCKAQSLILGSTNMAKLTAEEIAIATNKGWTVS